MELTADQNYSAASAYGAVFLWFSQPLGAPWAIHHGPALFWWIQFRKRIPKTVRRGFDSLFFLIGWLIWKERNARTFNGVATTPAQLEPLIQDEIDSWCLAGYS
jgi:hypothetical protein